MQSHPQRWAIGFGLALGLATSAPAQARNLSFQNNGANDMQVKVVANKVVANKPPRNGMPNSYHEVITFKIKKGEKVPVSIDSDTLYSIRINEDGNDNHHATYGNNQGINDYSDYILVGNYEIQDLLIGPD
jgi:hypothetical protein